MTKHEFSKHKIEDYFARLSQGFVKTLHLGSRT